MGAKRTTFRLLSAGIIALIAIGALGCGGDSQADSSGGYSVSPAYTELVTGLKEAAIAEKNFNAVRRAEKLSKPEKALIESFCEFAWQVPINHEAYKLSEHTFISSRIKNTAEISFRGGPAAYAGADDASIRALLAELEGIVGLRSISSKLLWKYSKACTH